MASNDLFAALISDIKSYSGKDPLLPWLRGIEKLKDSLPQQILKEKLPRFLQKCAQSFQSDLRYRNDKRYLRVWIQLMDFVDEPREVLRTMEAHQIGKKHPLFYQAYALYYEKNRKLEEAEKMYHLGVQNHVEPIGELEKAYEQFLQRMERHRKRKNQEKRTIKRVSDRSRIPPNNGKRNNTEGRPDDPRMLSRDDSVVAKFVDTAMVGKAEAEDACHHGLLDPTINMREAMSAINNMFREPLETAPVSRRSRQCQPKETNPDNEFEEFVDENLDDGCKPKVRNKESGLPMLQHSKTATHESHQEPLYIFIDDDQDSLEQSEFQNSTEDSPPSSSHGNGFVFLNPKDLPSDSPNGLDVEGSSRPRFREDTMMVRRIVGSTISEDPQVENACHHGLVEPTANLKEAMDDINNMFGKPIDFVRSRRVKKKPEKGADQTKDVGGLCILPDDEDDMEKQQVHKKGADQTKDLCILPDDEDDMEKQQVHKKGGDQTTDLGGFCILPDDEDDIEKQQVHTNADLPGKSKDSDLFETTVFTKQAMDDINKMFNMPLDF